jgi:uncharacterized protein involved in type VI secretion and phage assembly
MDLAAGPLPQAALELGEVVSVNDPEGLNRVQVRFLSRGPAAGDADNPDGGDSLAWALVATGFAGDGNGAFLIPDVGSRVVTSFLNGDPRYPVVLGAVWDGTTASPETLGGSGEEVDRWSFTGKAGTRIAMVEENGSSKIEVETANGNKLVIDDQQGSVKITQGGNTLTMSSGGIKLESHTVEISAAAFTLTAASAKVDTPLAEVSAFVVCQLLQTNTVISSAYTPGAGNMR